MFEGRPCANCGGRYPWVAMQFDHRPGEIKKFALSRHGNRSKAAILAEAAKCDLLCANCHAIVTHERRGRVTNRDKIRDHLATVGHITPVEALVVHGVQRLAPRIQELRDHGYNIATEIAKDATGRRYARYTMQPDCARNVARKHCGRR